LQKAAEMEQQQVMQNQAQTQQGTAPQFEDPQAQAAQDAVTAGQNANTGIGPLNPQAFAEGVAPSEGGQAAEAEAS
jgi:hypothetical protein